MFMNTEASSISKILSDEPKKRFVGKVHDEK
jgi:hypothetical protein